MRMKKGKEKEDKMAEFFNVAGYDYTPNIKRALLTIIRRFRTEKMFGKFSLLLFSAVGANVPVLSTWSSSMMASFPPPKMMISSLMATARWPCRGLGAGPVVFWILFHFRFSGFSAAGRAPLACSPSADVPAPVVAIFFR